MNRPVSRLQTRTAMPAKTVSTESSVEDSKGEALEALENSGEVGGVLAHGLAGTADVLWLEGVIRAKRRSKDGSGGGRTNVESAKAMYPIISSCGCDSEVEYPSTSLATSSRNHTAPNLRCLIADANKPRLSWP